MHDLGSSAPTSAPPSVAPVAVHLAAASAAPAGAPETQPPPASVAATLTPGAERVAAAAAFVGDAVDLWLSWAPSGDHDLTPGMQVTSTYARDTKLRATNYALLAEYFSGLFGDDAGAALAAGDAGPLDEAYVGGAS